MDADPAGIEEPRATRRGGDSSELRNARKRRTGPVEDANICSRDFARIAGDAL
jgi:hypothetical protein